jgi:hypothetical protein
MILNKKIQEEIKETQQGLRFCHPRHGNRALWIGLAQQTAPVIIRMESVV